jgi:hypothetical protein
MNRYPVIRASVPARTPPAWAVLERALLDAMDEGIDLFLTKYTDETGRLIWRDPSVADFSSRDGADDFYESFFNWPLLYLLGGADRLLPLSHRAWTATTQLLEDHGLVENGYEKGYDQFHQSEGYLFFYFLCQADPTNPMLRTSVQEFAHLFLGGEDAPPNYDAEHRLIRAPHNGSAGPRPGLAEGEPIHRWAAGMTQYGLPLHDVPGITSFDDLKDEALARRMGEATWERMGRGDIPANLAVTSLMTMAWLLTGDETYRSWVTEYVGAWSERAAANGGLLPDNVGLSGEIGEYQDGRWYGGHYGWTWPHGFYNIGASATVATANAMLLTGDPSWLDLARTQIDTMLELGEMRRPSESTMSLAHHWVGQLGVDGTDEPVLMIPYRYGPDGWFDYQPLPPTYALGIWAMSDSPADWERIEHLREGSGYSWWQVSSFRNKEDAGHDEPWTRFIVGDFSDYPERILQAAWGIVSHRLDKIRADDSDLTANHIHHWQDANPVTTEALVQLMLGVPQHLYYGGLLHARVRYFDAERKRPGLPQDVAALVEGPRLAEPVITLVNLSLVHERRVLIQAGGFAEHHFDRVFWDTRTSEYPGAHKAYAPPPVVTVEETSDVDARAIEVVLPPGTTIEIRAEMTRHVHPPTALAPWDYQS